MAKKNISKVDLLLLLSCLLVLLYAVVVNTFFIPRWETNDDVFMSMFAHGYGAAAESTPKIVFSNVLWGHFVRVIPEIHGIPGYSTASMLVVYLVGVSILWGLSRVGVNFIASMFIVLMVLIRPLLFPQFTVNSGILSVASLVFMFLYIKERKKIFLIFCFLLAYTSFLIREDMFLLILSISLPMVLRKDIFNNKFAYLAFIFFLCAISISKIIDNVSYKDEKFQFFNQFNEVRIPFTDYGASFYLNKEQNILKKYNYSVNDIELIAEWFFEDKNIADPVKLGKMMSEFGSLPLRKGGLSMGMQALKSLRHSEIFILVITAFFVLLMRPGLRVSISWIIALGAIFAMGVLGRPGIMRVYIPVLILLLILPFFEKKDESSWKNWVILGACLIGSILYTSYYGIVSKKNENFTLNVRNQYIQIVDKSLPIVTWGQHPRFEMIYPVFLLPEYLRKFHFYSLSSFTHFPFAVSYTENEEKNGFIDRFISHEGLFLIANEKRIKLLRQYCVERMNGEVRACSNDYEYLGVYNLRCLIKKK
ncbi:MAG: hypothetical protein Q4G66_07315 [bacterium]|nr:hypothetical protein [bacterium]